MTGERCRNARRAVVAHDTTEFNFGNSERAGLGHVGRGKSFGFFGHFALAVGHDQELRRPLGVLSFQIHSRSGDKGRRGHRVLQDDPSNESRRWLSLVDTAEAALHGCPAIHVMDREADNYAFLAALCERKFYFVIRMAAATRKLVDTDETTVGEKLMTAPVLTTRWVPISARGRSPLPSYRKRYPERRARTANLSVSAVSVTLERPDSSSRSPHKTLTLNIVHVVEPNPPAGEEPIEWRLWTSEAVGTEQEVLAVVDAYRCRWMIEEYFKALKTGCDIESRQLETQRGLGGARRSHQEQRAAGLARARPRARQALDHRARLPPRDRHVINHEV